MGSHVYPQKKEVTLLMKRPYAAISIWPLSYPGSQPQLVAREWNPASNVSHYPFILKKTRKKKKR
jgi:hypothetical protein